MAITPTQRIRQAQVEAVGVGTPSVKVDQAQVIAVYNYPTESVLIDQGQVLGAITASITQKITQAQVLAVVKGRVDNHKVRAWTFSLDDHDFYVLRLGMRGTLVYDLTTNTWTDWSSKDLNFWRAQTGMNWLGSDIASFNEGATGDAFAGDDTYGVIWGIVPEVGVDDDPRGEDYDIQTYTRQVVGGTVQRGRDTRSVGAAYLTCSVGLPQYTGAAITLRTSDNYGKSWIDHGTIDIEPGNYDQEIAWRSIGLIKAPGRIFEVTDNGASVRIDSLDTLEAE